MSTMHEKIAQRMRALWLCVADWALDAADWWGNHGRRVRELRNQKLNRK